ncbi:MAG: hypothetical protein AAGA66_20720 [Bacteroidota bacterium]
MQRKRLINNRLAFDDIHQEIIRILIVSLYFWHPFELGDLVVSDGSQNHLAVVLFISGKN